MLKTIALLLVVFVSLFWAIVLSESKNSYSKPSLFLAKFMILMVITTIARFYQFEKISFLYVYVDLLFLYAGVLAYPVYHIYFRLLTVEEEFSWKSHYQSLFLPLLLVTVYLIGIFFTPFADYKLWLFDREAYMNIPQIRFLKFIRFLIVILVVFQAFYYMVLNTKLLVKYSDRAEQFYSDIGDGKYNNANMLNILFVISCFLHIITAIDFGYLTSEKIIIYSVLYAIDYYMMGYMGYKQKAINPTFYVESDVSAVQPIGTELNVDKKIIVKKMLIEFEENKIFLNSDLTILDIVQAIGSNRTYISSIINQEFNQNFCAFVNSYRINELEQIVFENEHAVFEVLAESAGFGSVKSMKRAISSKTGLSVSEWRRQVLAR